MRPVDHYRLEPWGLYMARTSDHAHFHYLESWLLPDLGLRASIFHYHPFTRGIRTIMSTSASSPAAPGVWRSEDHYLDLVVRTGRDADSSTWTN